MGVRVIWDNKSKTVMRHIFEGTWDWTDFYNNLQTSHAMLDTVDHAVDQIIDIQRSGLIPSGVVTHIGRLPFKRHRNAGMTVLVGSNAFIRGLYAVMTRLYDGMDARFALATTPEEAYAILDRQREQVN